MRRKYANHHNKPETCYVSRNTFTFNKHLLLKSCLYYTISPYLIKRYRTQSIKERKTSSTKSYFTKVTKHIKIYNTYTSMMTSFLGVILIMMTHF